MAGRMSSSSFPRTAANPLSRSEDKVKLKQCAVVIRSFIFREGKCAVWVARNRFAVLDKTGQIVIKSLKNEVWPDLLPLLIL